MSATFSESAARQRFAALAASALKNALAKPQWAGRRLLLRGLHGLAPADLLPALLDPAAPTVAVYPEGVNGKRHDIAATRLADGSLLIPYYVDPSAMPSASSNTGGDGFAAALRTHFLAGATEQRILLILDQQPPETVLSTTEDAALLPELAWPALARAAVSEERPSAGTLVRSVVEDYLERCIKDARTTWLEAQRLWDWAASTKEQTEAQAGLDLPNLRYYVADDTPTPRRLAKSADWRRNLDDWVVSPSQDLARKLAAKKISPAGAAKVLDSHSLRGLDYSGFTLEDLAPGSGGAALALDSFQPVSGGFLSLSGPSSFIVWLPADGGELRFRLLRPAGTDESVSLRWQHEGYGALHTSGREAVADIAPPAGQRWLFGTVKLSSPGGAVQEFHLAVFFSDDGIAGFEQELEVDPDAGGFICADQPQIGVWARNGAELGTAQLENSDAGESGEGPQYVTGLWDGSPVGPVPVLPRGADEPGQDDDSSDPDTVEPDGISEPMSSAEREREEDETLEEAWDPLLELHTSGRGSAVLLTADQPTLVHAMLALRQDVWPESVSIPGYTQPSEARVSARHGTRRLSVRPQFGKTSLLEPEQLILKHPQGAAYRIQDGHLEVCEQLPRPEPSWAREMAAFADARHHFFELAAAAGSVYALDPHCHEVAEYVRAYRELLNALPREGTSRTEYEQLLRIDTAEISGIPDLFVAPTSPLTMAYYAALRTRFATLVRDGAEDVDQADVRAFSPQYLLPLLKTDSGWHEAVPCPTAFLWRRYSPLDGHTPGALERNCKFIAGRIAFFLDVHPGLNNPDATVAVTFAEPGAAPALGAVREFYRKDLTGETYSRPKLQVVLDGDTEETRQAIGDLVASASSDPLDRLVCTRTVLRHRPVEGQDFSHLTFLFRSPGERKVRPVSLQGRSGTAYAASLACSPGRVVIPDSDPVFATGIFAPEPGPDATDLEAIQYRCLELVGGQGGEVLAPGQTRMVTVRTSEKALSEWYGKSAWVVHLDRLVGLEAFTTAGPSRRTVLEYEEGADPDSYGYDGITGTESVGPYVAALNKALEGIATTDPQQSRALMALLESVSGRWALQIVQRPQNKVLERAGTACAIRYAQTVEQALDPAHGLRGVVSLEELIPSFPQAGIPRRLAATRRGRDAMCDDLLLVSVLPRPGQPPLVQMSVMEIKFWSEAPDYSAAAEQVEESNKWLASRFQNPGALRDLRGRELAEIIRSAVARNAAFGLASSPRRDAEELLQRVADGDYELGFGHWRNGSYRRGMVVSVERNRAGSLSLAQLNGTGGPVDVVSVGADAVRNALHGDTISAPGGWHPLDPVPPAAPPSHPAAAESSLSGEQVTALPQHRERASEDDRRSFSQGVASEQDDGHEVATAARSLDGAFAKYGLAVEPFEVARAHCGPSVIRFRTRTLGKLSITEIERRSRDITREVAAAGEVSVGTELGFVTVDVPRQNRRPVQLAEVIHEVDSPARAGALPFIAGISPSGSVQVADLSRLPHLLVAGATGSGKSVFLRGLLIELLRARTPEQLQLVIVDPKRLDFTPFAKAPHLRDGRIISDPDIALETLRHTLESELDRRQPVLESAGVSSAAEFYESGGSLEELPQLVILVDEFADLVLSGSDRKGFSELIQRYAQLTRAYGIFLVLATQRPSVDVITGSIKANLSARIAFSLPSARDSMTVLDQGGAEDLLGDGDLLFYRNGKVQRLQAPFTSLADVRAALS
ncbi:FtsK/SpoIIIE domain-containing protein [Streptomyces sp. NPDC101132]|uniref:FtsK/SpoIIIE domain-containing protein n=1 Tax=Streptomyces sp. NPDC101132 TaxID=3366110 RepID=UPI0038251057